MTKEIEVIDQYGARHRFPADRHHYEWRLKHGTMDIEDHEFLDVFRRCSDVEDDFIVISTFPRPAMVGLVTDDTTQLLPLRELQLEQCPRCGFVSKIPK